MRPGRVRAAVLVLPATVLLLAALLPGTARAAGGSGVRPSGPPRSRTVASGTCVLYANTRGFGADCLAGTGHGATLRQILGGDPFPDCRVDPVPPGLEPPPVPDGRRGTWWLRTCLRGVDENGPVAGQQVTRDSGFAFFAAGTPIPRLTPAQLAAWNVFRAGYPVPEPVFGPAHEPRVAIPTDVWLSDASSRPVTATVFDGTEMITMRASVRSLAVRPGRTPGEPAVTCAGRGRRYDRSRPPADQPDACLMTYDRSSAARPGGTYAVTVTARWQVEYRDADRGWRVLAVLPVTNVFATPVEEIQTLAE